jgi:xylan 1,4-beta-xylosidase
MEGNGETSKCNGWQYKELEKAGQLQLYNSPRWNEVINGKTVLKFNLPRQAVSLIQITW